MTKAIHKRKRLTKGSLSLKVRVRAVMAGNMSAGRQDGVTAVVVSFHRIHVQKTELAGMKPQYLGPGAYLLQQDPVS